MSNGYVVLDDVIGWQDGHITAIDARRSPIARRVS